MYITTFYIDWSGNTNSSLSPVINIREAGWWALVVSGWTVTPTINPWEYEYDFSTRYSTKNYTAIIDFWLVENRYAYIVVPADIVWGGGWLTTEEHDKLFSLENSTGGWGGFSINYQAINSHTTKKINELQEVIEKKEIPITDLKPIEDKLNEIDSHIDIAKDETINRIEEAEIDLRKDVNRGKSELKEDNVKTRNLVRQKSEKVVKYAEKQLDRQEKIEKMIDNESEEIETLIEQNIDFEADEIENQINQQIDKEIEEIESNLSNNGNDNGTEG